MPLSPTISSPTQERLALFGFESKYRDFPFLLEGQFLRAEPRTSGHRWESEITQGVHPGPKGRRDYTAMYIGHVGTEPVRWSDGSDRGALPGGRADRSNFNRAARLQSGDPVLLRGNAITWRSVYETPAVIFDRCEFSVL